jgi:hypothetical protein
MLPSILVYMPQGPLGVRRECVTEAAGQLQKGGVGYSRGRIAVLDRANREEQVCIGINCREGCVRGSTRREAAKIARFNDARRSRIPGYALAGAWLAHPTAIDCTRPG